MKIIHEYRFLLLALLMASSFLGAVEFTKENTFGSPSASAFSTPISISFTK